MHNIIRHGVDDSTIVVIVPRSKEELRDCPHGSRSTAKNFQRDSCRISQYLGEVREMTREVMLQVQDFQETTQPWEQGGGYCQV